MGNGKPAYRADLMNDDDFTIVNRYQAEFRGVVQYYLLAHNVFHFKRLKWVMEESLAKPLRPSTRPHAGKYFGATRAPYRPSMGNGLASRL